MVLDCDLFHYEHLVLLFVIIMVNGVDFILDKLFFYLLLVQILYQLDLRLIEAAPLQQTPFHSGLYSYEQQNLRVSRAAFTLSLSSSMVPKPFSLAVPGADNHFPVCIHHFGTLPLRFHDGGTVDEIGKCSSQ